MKHRPSLPAVHRFTPAIYSSRETPRENLRCAKHVLQSELLLNFLQGKSTATSKHCGSKEGRAPPSEDEDPLSNTLSSEEYSDRSDGSPEDADEPSDPEVRAFTSMSAPLKASIVHSALHPQTFLSLTRNRGILEPQMHLHSRGTLIF